MERFDSRGYNFFRLELFVGLLVVIILVTIITPSVFSFVGKMKLNSAIDSAYSYKDCVSKYYVSQLMFDTNFKLDGKYTISDGALVDDNNIYDILFTGNVPSDGYLNYENNELKYGCIVVNGYSIVIEDGNMIATNNNGCLVENDVNLALCICTFKREYRLKVLTNISRISTTERRCKC